MDSTPNLQLPYLIAAQAQKHVTHNEALRALDAVVQLLVLDKDLATPPGSPADGSRYIVAASPTGAWAGNADHIAAWQDGAWAFYTPREGWLAWVADEDKLYAFSGSAWVEFAAPGVGAPLWGINATADATNRLAVKSTASLFDNVGNGHQKKINKAAAGDTASTLYQTGYSGRAEHGLTGDDNFHVKVSPDGSTWYEAMIVDRSTGNVGFGTAPTARMTVSNNVTAPPSVGSTACSILWARTPSNPSYVFDAFAGFHVLTARRANGTNASKSALAANDPIFQFNANGYNGSDYSNARARIRLFAGEAWSGSAQGTYVTIDTTANGGTSIAEKVRVTGDGKVGIGTTAPSNKLGIEGIAAPETDNSYTLGTASQALERGVRGNRHHQHLRRAPQDGGGRQRLGARLRVRAAAALVQMAGRRPRRRVGRGNLRGAGAGDRSGGGHRNRDRHRRRPGGRAPGAHDVRGAAVRRAADGRCAGLRRSCWPRRTAAWCRPRIACRACGRCSTPAPSSARWPRRAYARTTASSPRR